MSNVHWAYLLFFPWNARLPVKQSFRTSIVCIWMCMVVVVIVIALRWCCYSPHHMRMIRKRAGINLLICYRLATNEPDSHTHTDEYIAYTMRIAETDSTIYAKPRLIQQYFVPVGIIECVYSFNVIVLSHVNSKFVSFRSLDFCSFVFDFWLSVDGICVCKSILYKIRWNKTLVKIKICNKLLKHLQKYEILKIRYNKH